MIAWVPSDAELDALSRGLPSHEPPAERAEHNRTTLLARSGTEPQQARRGSPRIVAAIAIPIAAAAAIALWLTRQSGESQVHATAVVEPRGGAKYDAVSDWPDRVVRVDDGTLAVTLPPLAGTDRFRVRGPDGELESTDSTFVVTVARGHLAQVAVSTGRVELRIDGVPAVFLAANQSWSRPITAQRDTLELAKPEPQKPTVKRSQEPTITDAQKPQSPARPEPSKREPAARVERTIETPSRERPVTPPSTVTPPPPTTPAPSVAAPRAPPGESDFRDGMAALRVSNAAGAARSFGLACTLAQGALAEDACFWVGAAARRAGATTQARDALEQFLRRFPSSARAGEAAALLGWILIDLGDLDRAEPQLRRAANDRVPKVRDSATRGLEAIERKRAGR